MDNLFSKGDFFGKDKHSYMEKTIAVAKKRGLCMKNERVRIVDIAEELGLSTATVSNVIHGKTKKISDETVKRVQELLEKRQYIPSMAGGVAGAE